MRRIICVCACWLLIAPLYARGIGRGGVGYGGFRGGYGGRGFVGRGFVGRGFVGRGFVGHGFRPFGYYRFGYPYYGFSRRAFWYPYAPVYFGAYWDYGWGYDPGWGYGASYVPVYPPQPAVTVVYPQNAAPPTPSVIINQLPPRSAAPERRTEPETYRSEAERRPSRADRSDVYLIAFNDRTIRAALAYWVTDGTLHYLDLDHVRRTAPLSAVDRQFSAELNRERRVPFDLPEGAK